MLEARSIQKSFFTDKSETRVLRGIDLKIQAGEFVCILGSSGAGKSTLLHVLSSLESPSAGQVFFEGQDLYSKNEDELSVFRQKQIGFVFQFHHLLPEFTALENVMMPLLIQGVARKEAAEKAVFFLERFGLGHRQTYRPSVLSGGEQQRVAVARAMIHAPQVIFADEPTGNLDHENGKQLMEILFDLKKEKKSLVMVTHNLEIARSFDRKIFLEDGLITRES